MRDYLPLELVEHAEQTPLYSDARSLGRHSFDETGPVVGRHCIGRSGARRAGRHMVPV